MNEVWAKVGHTAKAHDVLSAELEAALDAPLAMHLGGDTEKGEDSKEPSDETLRDTCTIHDDMSGAPLLAWKLYSHQILQLPGLPRLTTRVLLTGR